MDFFISLVILGERPIGYIPYCAVAGSITGLLLYLFAPYCFGWPSLGQYAISNGLLTICIAFAILAEIPVFNILMGLFYGGCLGWGIENYVKTVDWSMSPIIPLFLVISLLMLAVLYKKGIEKEHQISYSRGSADHRKGSSSYRNVQKKVNPIFQGSKIEKDIWGDRVLRGSSDETVGKLTEGGFFDSKRTQIILDEKNQKVGKITEGGLFDSKDTQIIIDKNDEKQGSIETNFWGDRVITDKSGEKVGEITKNFWGETVIKKTSDKYDYDSGNKGEVEDKIECPYCGEEYDASESECPYCGEECDEDDY